MLLCRCVLLCTHLRDLVPRFRRHPFLDLGLESVCVCVCVEFFPSSTVTRFCMVAVIQSDGQDRAGRGRRLVPFCHHKFEHHFIASIFFIYRRSLCYRAIQKNVQHKVLEFLKLARLARWLNIFNLVRGLFQSDPILIMRACL